MRNEVEIGKGRNDRKGEVLFEDFIRIILWVIFFAIALLGVYFLIRKVGLGV